MHHKKRKRRRGGIKGCGFCKPHKSQGCRRVEKQQRLRNRRANLSYREQMEEV